MTGFDLSIGRPDAPLHAAAHSHHPWPDVSFAAQQEAWADAARLLDGKWDHVFGTIIPQAQAHIARQLSLPDPATIAFGPNTHGFVLRLLSCLPADTRPRILTTDSEFMSFSRQIARLEDDRLVSVTRVPTEPFNTFEERFTRAARTGEHNFVFFSQVFFNSGFALRDIAAIVDAVPTDEALIVIDGYHGFMAIPTDVSSIASRAFYLAGGYKYAMAGEGACFLHCPPGYGPRPRDTGWYAGFGSLGAAAGEVGYARDGSRFLGATFDVTALYRFNAAQNWLASEGLSVSVMLDRVRDLERALLRELDRLRAPIGSSKLIVRDEKNRGRFLAFETPRAADLVAQLASRNVIVDHRGNRLRVGLGIYHDAEGVDRLARAIVDCG
ncbi:MAG: aminotransferase class V-fold PLP-dependent enzyme [Rhizomicrobium sp.]|jgi:selenocysteine lyase/cysteine desulfurase